jgi:UBX domain-containing protein 1
MAMRNRRTQVYEPPAEETSKPAEVVAFAGRANALGHRATPASPTDAPTPASAGALTPVSTGASASTSPQVEFSVDESQPTTNIQFRLPSGSKLVGKFNHTHTVTHLRQFLASSGQAGDTGAHLSLHTIRPRRELTDDQETLEAAGLLATAIIVKRN